MAELCLLQSICMLNLSRLQLLMELHSSPAALCCSLLQLCVPVLLLLNTGRSLQERCFMCCLQATQLMPVSAPQSSAGQHRWLHRACSALGVAGACSRACLHLSHVVLRLPGLHLLERTSSLQLTGQLLNLRLQGLLTSLCLLQAGS